MSLFAAIVAISVLAGTLVAIGNANLVARCYQDGKRIPEQNFFDPIWNNTAGKFAVLFFIIQGIYGLLSNERELLIHLLIGCLLAALFGTVIGVICAAFAHLGARIDATCALALSTLALYTQLFLVLIVLRTYGP